MRSRQLDHNFITILITALITLASWVGFQVYHAYTRVELPQGIEKHLQPLDPKLETSVLDKLEQRQP